MPDIPGVPEKYANAPGVHMTTPPTDYIDKAMGPISAAVSKMEPGEKVRIVWIAQHRKGQTEVNLAAVQKFSKGKFDFRVTEWIGYKWGEPIEAGIAGAVSW